MTAVLPGEQPTSTTSDAGWAATGARLARSLLSASGGFVALFHDGRLEPVAVAGAAPDALNDGLAAASREYQDHGSCLVAAGDRRLGTLVGQPFATADGGRRGLIGGFGAAPPDPTAVAALADLARLVGAQAALEAELAAARAAAKAAEVEAATGAFRERRLRAAIDSLPQHFWITDTNGCYVEQNDWDRRIFGDLLGRAAHEAEPPLEQAARWNEHHRRVLAGETLRRSVWRSQPDGERWIESIMAPLCLDGAIVGLVGLTIDRTEQALVEQRLAESEARLKAALDALPFPFFICDADGRHVLQNTVDRALWGDCLGKSHAELPLPPELQVYMPEVMDSIRDGRTYSTQIGCEVAGERREFEEIYAPVHKDGVVGGFVGIAIDHTDRVAIERRLQRSEAHLKAIIDALPCALFVCDLDGLHLLQNSVDRALWGDCVGKTYAELDLPDELVANVPTIIERVKAGQTLRLQIDYEHGGRRRAIEEIYAPVYDGEMVAGFVGLGIDHTDRVAAEERVRRSEARLADYLATASDWLWETDADHRIVSLDGWPEDASLDADELIGKRRWELVGVDPQEDPHWRRYLDDLEARRPVRGFVYAFPHPDDAQIWIEISGNPVLDEAGRFLGYRGIGRDVSERCRAEVALREAHARLEMLAHSGLIGIASGRGYCVEEANDAFLEMVGLERGRLAGQGLDWRAITPPEILVEEARVSDDPFRRPHATFSFEKQFMRPDGSRVPVLVNVVVLDAGRRRWFALIQDLTPMKLAEARVRELAERDGLTGLANRHVLFEQLRGDLDERRRPGSTGALFMLDLDNFKAINDSLGHEAGDQLLRAVGKRIAAVVRDSDTIARLGGDEFAIVLRRLVGPMAAAEVADKVLAALAEPLEIEGRRLLPRGSIGIALFPGDGGEATELLRKADIALYEAKAAGRGGYCFFEPALLESIERRRRIAEALQASVATADFEIALQPQLHLASGAHAGIEALVRWRFDGREMPPADIITIAVESGSIVRLGQIVRERALDAWRRCAAAGLDPGRLAINLATVELKQPGFVGELSRLLAAMDVPPTSLEIEITEAALLDRDGEALAAILSEIRAQGMTIALDDFGSGSAALAHFKRFPVDRLKIARSFIQELGGGHAAAHDVSDAAIVRSIINLAHTLGMSVLAKGVETAAQEDFLKRHRCDLVQGGRYAAPLAPGELERYLRRAGQRADDHVQAL